VDGAQKAETLSIESGKEVAVGYRIKTDYLNALGKEN
jgi:hypothetical protein